MAYNYSSIGVDAYTIALLKFNDSNNPLKDECGNTWEQSTSELPQYKTDSTVGGYLDLGKEAFIKCSQLNGVTLFNDDFTIDFWIKSNGTNYTVAKDLVTCSADVSKVQGFRTFLTGANIGVSYKSKEVYHSGENYTSTTSINKAAGVGNFKDLTSWTHIAIVRYYNAIIIFVNGSSITVSSNGVQSFMISGAITDLVNDIYIGNRTAVGNKIEFCIKNLRISNIARWTGMNNDANTQKPPFSIDTLEDEEMTVGKSVDDTGVYKDFYTKSLLRFDKIININGVSKLQDECGLYWNIEGNAYLSKRNSYYGKSLHLNGSNSKILLDGGIYLGGEDFTIDMWAYRPRTLTKGAVAFCFYNEYSLTTKLPRYFCLYMTCPQDKTHLNICYATFEGKNVTKHIGNNTPATNSLDHIALVYQHDEKVINVFINGKSIIGNIEFNIEKYFFNKMYVGSIDPKVVTFLEEKGYPNIDAACSIDNFRISNIARWTGNFYDGKDRTGANSPGRTLVQNIYEAQWADNPNQYSPFKTDIFTEVLLHFDDINNPWKDECGHTFDFGYVAAIQLMDPNTKEYTLVEDPEIYKPKLTDFHSVYGNSCVSFALETNNYSEFGWVKYVPSADNPISIGNQDFTIDFWMYSNSGSSYNAPVFKISTWKSIKWNDDDDEENHPVGYDTVIQLSNKYTSADFYKQLEMGQTSDTYKTYPSLEYTVKYNYVEKGIAKNYNSPSIIEADSTTNDFFGGGNVIAGSGKSRTFLCGRKVHCAIVYYHFQGLLVYFQNGYPTLQIRTNISRSTITDIIIGEKGFIGEIDDFRYSDGVARYSGVFNIEPGYPDLTYTEEKSIYTTVVKNDKLHFFLDFDDPKRNTSSPFIDKVRGIEMLNGKDQCVNKVTKDLINLTNVGISYDESAKKSRYKYAGYFDGTSYLESSRNNKDGNGNQMLVTLPQGDWTIDWFSYDIKSNYYDSSGIFCLLPYNSSFNSKSSALSKTFIAVHRPASAKANMLYIKTNWSRWNNKYTSITTNFSRIDDTIHELNAMSGTNYTNYTGDTGYFSIGDYGVNKLIHWAIVKQESNISVYRQGIRTFICDISTTGSFDNFAGTYDLYLGIAPGEDKTDAASESNLRNQTKYYTFKGYIDNFRITHEALFKTNFEIGDHPQPDHYYRAFVY